MTRKELTNLHELAPAVLERRIEKARAHARTVNDALILAGRGHELARETRQAAKAGNDDLAEEWCDASDTLANLLFERRRRMEYHGSTKPVKTDE